ncbi:aldo/keto reductase [Salinicola tamaricis]|uniref:aldo/keto reductase n=1 Tax=Salinicola tamaricis TaxID=1771309 RepID=UPI001A91EE88|nr:aldo/keto reductase [Salinicola tamaricis]
MTLGTVPFGGSHGFEKAASVDVKGARRLLDIAFEAGVNLVDTADLYSHGQAEEITAKALGDKRQDIILATKGRSPLGDDPNASGASRYHLIRAVEASLKRLGTDHIDLYQIHNWDGVTPVEETLEALHHLVTSGKVRYWGTSNYTGWQMMKTLGKAELHGLTKPISQQIYYTPESREAEYELMPLALDQNLGSLIWGPLGEGFLTGKVRRGQPTPPDTRQGNGWPEPYVHDMERAYDIIETLIAIGEAHDCSPARVCLAWLKDRPGVTSLIVGAQQAKRSARQSRRRRADAERGRTAPAGAADAPRPALSLLASGRGRHGSPRPGREAVSRWLRRDHQAPQRRSRGGCLTSLIRHGKAQKRVASQAKTGRLPGEGAPSFVTRPAPGPYRT